MCVNIILYPLQEIALEQAGSRLGRYLKVIVTSLVPFAQKMGHTMQAKALTILHFLINDTNESLKQAIANLDPFPDSKPFEELNVAYYR